MHVGLKTFKQENVTHLPLIKIISKQFNTNEIISIFSDIPDYTHIIFTSKNGVDIFFKCLHYHGYANIKDKKCFCIGKSTAESLRKKGVKPYKIAQEETQEGVIRMVSNEKLDKSYILLPQSSKSRPNLINFLSLNGIRHQLCQLYDTHVNYPEVKPNLEGFDEIIFTSPSTVEAFIKVFGLIPNNKKLTAIGPITNQKLKFI